VQCPQCSGSTTVTLPVLRILQYIYSQHAASTVFYAYSKSTSMFTSTSMHIWAPLSTSSAEVHLHYSTCLRDSIAPSTVCVLLLHVTTISTVHLQPACSLHSLLRLQQIYIYAYIYVYAHMSTFIYVFSGPSLTFIRWKRMHGYTSLIRARVYSNARRLCASTYDFTSTYWHYYVYITSTPFCAASIFYLRLQRPVTDL
jgi:hypothetical protein